MDLHPEWNRGIVLNDDGTILYEGYDWPPITAGENVRGCIPCIPDSVNTYCLEVSIISGVTNGDLVIGLGPSETDFLKMIGITKNTIGYWGTNGGLYNGSEDPMATTDTYKDGDVVGYEFSSKQLRNGVTYRSCRFRKNGRYVGPSIWVANNLYMYPYISFQAPGSLVKPSVRVNGKCSILQYIFGQYKTSSLNFDV